jgi:putative glutamine amidotransferase
MANRPVIGVAGENEVVRKHFGDQPVSAAPQLIIDAVSLAGGIPVVLPVGTAPEALQALDGLVLTGGVDLGVQPERDLSEHALVHEAAASRLPLLGICRGLQVLGVASGGSLVEDLGQSHILVPLDRDHPLHVEAGSLVEALVPQRRVGSLHHQSVATYGAGWRCTATAPDGVVEALEWHDQEAWPALGVQWHPELDHTGPAVFDWLVRRASQPRSRYSPSLSASIPVIVGTYSVPSGASVTGAPWLL